jgi:hypothetical protein
MPKTIYPPENVQAHRQQFPNIRIGFVSSVYRELETGSRTHPRGIHLPTAFTADTVALVRTLPGPYQSLLSHIGVKIVLNRNHRALADSTFKRRRIRINVEFLADFRFENGAVIGSSRAARMAYATLFEEATHYLFGWLNFSRTHGYKAAMQRQIASIGKPQRAIMRLERAYNAFGSEGKRAFTRLHPDDKPEELLIDLLRIKDYLAAQNMSPGHINGFMSLTFPDAWPVAQHFEQRLQSAAQDVPRRRPLSASFCPHGIDAQRPQLHRMVRRTLQSDGAFLDR